MKKVMQTGKRLRTTYIEKGSSTYDNSVQAIDLLYEEYPEYRDRFHIHSFDGMGYNALYGSPVVHAAQMVGEGASLDEILGYLTDILPRRQIYFGIYDLKYAAKSGRVPSAATNSGPRVAGVAFTKKADK